MNEHGQKGFTLLEVMIALSILAIVLTAVLSLHARSITMLDRSSADILAPYLAAEVLSSISRELPDPASLQGNFERFPDLSWQASVTPAPGLAAGMVAEEESRYLFFVDVRILRHKTLLFRLETLRGVLP
ncbi:type IV pilus modification PilV family protein [Desulfobotulus mexicanus]|uniref:Prepilin-type N-terminal cleavage/methylation domain-containing protein n=1 Tax=Desulfobotulus mexicanus TaxID=2586642 RepID=A0A5Q4VDQ6_9BACT|nr:prepilin-type N-terminal cleavage/methylation domain-containing protein [Desulfobotulus mexicanus]TYT75765.1 prepilin-type N-terminal cleavage/methylation domain-containing protein [Desulfobotulus mexicanus]